MRSIAAVLFFYLFAHMRGSRLFGALLRRHSKHV